MGGTHFRLRRAAFPLRQGSIRPTGRKREKRKKEYLRERLEEQRHLLRKSIREMAAGDLAEAIHIAAIIRVLVHETGSSKPLLKQLTPNYLQMEILDRIPSKEEDLPPGKRSVVVLSFPVSVRMTSEGIFLNPDLNVETYAPSILGKWWQRPCLILPGLGGFSRRELVLGLANKEGGAHVDPDISKRYHQLLESKSVHFGWNKETVAPLNVSRLMTGQAGIELLDCLDRNFPTIK